MGQQISVVLNDEMLAINYLYSAFGRDFATEGGRLAMLASIPTGNGAPSATPPG